MFTEWQQVGSRDSWGGDWLPIMTDGWTSVLSADRWLSLLRYPERQTEGDSLKQTDSQALWQRRRGFGSCMRAHMRAGKSEYSTMRHISTWLMSYRGSVVILWSRVEPEYWVKGVLKGQEDSSAYWKAHFATCTQLLGCTKRNLTYLRQRWHIERMC